MDKENINPNVVSDDEKLVSSDTTVHTEGDEKSTDQTEIPGILPLRRSDHIDHIDQWAVFDRLPISVDRRVAVLEALKLAEQRTKEEDAPKDEDTKEEKESVADK